MVAVKGGIFKMGSNDYDREKPIHEVTVSDFYIGKHEVTQKLYKEIMGTTPSHFKNCDNCPVENVSWNDAQEFIKKLNAKTGKNYCLPSEAQWEYAARGGVETQKWSGTNNENELINYAWYRENSNNKTHSVGTKKPNKFGIYDMSGNVWEWCEDWYDEEYYKNSPKTNPINTKKGSYRVLRGGSWINYATYCRVAYRYYINPTNSYFNDGFRLAGRP